MPKTVPYHLSAAQRFVSPLLRRRTIRNLILLPEILSGRRSSNKPEDYRIFKQASVESVQRVVIDVSDLDRSIRWYARVPAFRLAGVRKDVNDPSEPGGRLDLAYFDIGRQPESLVLVRRIASDGTVRVPSLRGFFHVAFQMEDGATAFGFAERMRAIGVPIAYGPVGHHSGPGGDGESGGNKAVYIEDPDGSWLEFFHGMDSVDGQHQGAGPAPRDARSVT